MTTPTRSTLQSVLTDATVDTTPSMVGLTKDMATKIISSGLPLMANDADAVGKANTNANVNEMEPRRQPRTLHAWTLVTALAYAHGSNTWRLQCIRIRS